MKNSIFNLFKTIFRKQLVAFCLKNFPLQLTTKTLKHKLILVKKGKIRQWRMYDENHIRIHNFKINRNNQVIINP